MIRAKSTSLEAKLKKLDNQLKDLKQKSENALADIKLRVSQTRNDQLVIEREVRSKEAEQQVLMRQKIGLVKKQNKNYFSS